MKIAIEGCCHGELDAIYQHIKNLEFKNGYTVDLLLICGDFQAVRNYKDLQCMAVPNKYKALQTFHKYYTCEKEAPILTIVIGGNHEASNYMWELYHGGWLAPNIYFLGHAGCVQVNGIRIAGASGIYKMHDFKLGNHEKVPYDASSIRSIYHIREYNVRRLSLLSTPRIFLSHDWPQSVEQYGDLAGLLRRKSFLREDINSGKLGSPPLMGLLRTLQPEWWFSAHLHARYEATVFHQDRPLPPAAVQNPDEISIEDDQVQEGKNYIPRNPDEILLDDEEEDVEVPLLPPPPCATTKFLALDKCLPNRQFLEIITLPTEESRQPPLLTFDPEWLAITRAFHPWLSTTRHQRPFPPEAEARDMVSKEFEWVSKNVTGDALLVSEHQRFIPTAPGPGNEGAAKNQQPPWYTNPQTEAFCQMLELENKVNAPPTQSRDAPP